MRLRAGLSAALLLLGYATPAYCNTQNIEAVPNAWRLENYTGDSVVIWFTGAVCGGVHFGAGWSSDDRDRLWATVSTGKAAGKMVGLRFDDASCELVSFYLKES